MIGVSTKAFQDLLQKKVSRREFLAYMGATMLALTGINGLIKSLSMHNEPKRNLGYGGSAYGGNKKAS